MISTDFKSGVGSRLSHPGGNPEPSSCGEAAMPENEYPPPKPAAAAPCGAVQLFLLFSQLGLSSFGGGVPAWMHRAFVQRRGWIGEGEFSAALALARLMPGVNVINLAVLIGQRLKGAAGAAAGLLGLTIAPSAAVIGLAALYDRFAGTTGLAVMLEGCAVAAAGLLIGMGLQSGGRIIAKGLRRRARSPHSIGAPAILAVVFVAVGVLHLPTVATVLCLSPLSIALAFRYGSASRPDARDDRR